MRIIVSSLQDESVEEHRLWAHCISKVQTRRRFFDAFILEDDVAMSDRRTDEANLDNPYPSNFSYPSNFVRRLITDALRQAKRIKSLRIGQKDVLRWGSGAFVGHRLKAGG